VSLLSLYDELGSLLIDFVDKGQGSSPCAHSLTYAFSAMIVGARQVIMSEQVPPDFIEGLDLFIWGYVDGTRRPDYSLTKIRHALSALAEEDRRLQKEKLDWKTRSTAQMKESLEGLLRLDPDYDCDL
jgi:hypothetical protein